MTFTTDSDDEEDDDRPDIEGLFASESGVISDQFLHYISTLEEEGYQPIDILAGMNFAFCDLLCKMKGKEQGSEGV